MELTILFEDEHILVCEKPSGVPSQSDKSSDFDMVNALKNYVYENGTGKGQPYIGLVHRLDRPVGGIMVFAKSPFAAKELSKQIQLREMKKYYYALITADLSSEIGAGKKHLVDYLVKDGKGNLSKVTTQKDKNGKKAELYYQVLDVKKDILSENVSLVEIELLTGRHHQIRVQMKEHVGGLLGDTKYNSFEQEQKGWREIALFAYKLEFKHPKTKKVLSFSKQPEGSVWQTFFS